MADDGVSALSEVPRGLHKVCLALEVIDSTDFAMTGARLQCANLLSD